MTRFILSLALLLSFAASGQTLSFGTLAAEGTPWYSILEQTRQDWRRISGGKVNLRLYGAGTQGEEAEMLQRVRIGQLHGVMVSNAGLPQVEKSAQCLLIPLMFENYAEYDYVAERVAPKIEAKMRTKGLTVLAWGDVGWVHFFARRPAPTLKEIRGMTLFTGIGDPDSERLYGDFGFRVRPLAYTDMLMALKSGLVDEVNVPPLFVMLNQAFAIAKNMTDIKWSPLPGATMINSNTWENIPAEWRPAMKKAAEEAALKQRAQIRKMGDDAIAEMKKRGLNVVSVPPAAAAQWKAEVEAGWPKLRGGYCEAPLFDEVLSHRNQFRAGKK